MKQALAGGAGVTESKRTVPGVDGQHLDHTPSKMGFSRISEF